MDGDFFLVGHELFIDGRDALIYKTGKGGWLTSPSLKSTRQCFNVNNTTATAPTVTERLNVTVIHIRQEVTKLILIQISGQK